MYYGPNTDTLVVYGEEYYRSVMPSIQQPTNTKDTQRFVKTERTLFRRVMAWGRSSKKERNTEKKKHQKGAQKPGSTQKVFGPMASSHSRRASLLFRLPRNKLEKRDCDLCLWPPPPPSLFHRERRGRIKIQNNYGPGDFWHRRKDPRSKSESRDESPRIAPDPLFWITRYPWKDQRGWR